MTEPPLDYWRRAKLFVQLLAIDLPHWEKCQRLEELAHRWNILIDDLMPETSWDERRLLQLVQRLAEHALKYTQ